MELACPLPACLLEGQRNRQRVEIAGICGLESHDKGQRWASSTQYAYAKYLVPAVRGVRKAGEDIGGDRNSARPGGATSGVNDVTVVSTCFKFPAPYRVGCRVGCLYEKSWWIRVDNLLFSL